MEQQRDGGGGPDSQETRGGIRFITEELLLRLSGCQSLALVRSLNLSSLTVDKPIKFIENLHGCRRLQTLKLNHNAIEKMERLNVLTELRELQLAHNNIQRIEGLELMSCLQHLNLSHNRMELVPVWLGKNLRSLQTLHLRHNLLTSIYEVSRLRSLSSLSALTFSGNPACSLQYSRLFPLNHLRTPDSLDGLPITSEERGHAHQLYIAEQLEGLQKEEDNSQSELSRLQEEQQVAVVQLHQQEEENRALKALMETQRQELHAKSLLLERTAAELSGASLRQYQLEQEWTFYKIDGKLDPLASFSGRREVHSVVEGPYAVTSTPRTSCPSSPSPQTPESAGAGLQRPRPLLEDGAAEQSEDEGDHQQMEQTDPEERHTQQELLDVLLTKLLVLDRPGDEAEETHRQKEGQTEELESKDPQHVQVSSRWSSCRQTLNRMSGKKNELEDRLEEMLSRIAMETQEIKELEQQLNDGQILANEVLQRDLEGIISGLQAYLSGLKDQAGQAQQQVQSLQAENQSLQLHLEDARRHCRWLEDSATSQRGDMSIQQEALSLLQMESHDLRDRQVELEVELQHLRDQKSSLQQEVQTLQDQVDHTTRTHRDRSVLGAAAVLAGPEQLDGDTHRSSPQDQIQPSREPLQLDRYLEQIVGLRNHVAQLEARVTRDQVREQKLRVKVQRSRARSRRCEQLEAELERNRQQLQEVHQERDALHQQLRSQDDGERRNLAGINRKLRRLCRSVADADQLTATAEQLRALSDMVELLHAPQAPNLAPQGTQDSGLDLHYLSSPEGGRWLYIPDTAAEWSAGGDGDADGTPPPAAPAGHGGLFHAAPVEGAAPHCNLPERGDEVDRCVCAEPERLEEDKKKKLQLEIKQLRRTLRQHRSVLEVCEEVECVEKTLLKRRAELRQADRLLLEAQSCISTTREQASSAQRDATVLQLTAQEGATCLLDAFRELQGEVEELVRSRREEEQVLREVEEELRSREEELQRVNTDIHSASDRFAALLSDHQDSQTRFDSLVRQEEQQERRLGQRREELQAATCRAEEVGREELRLHGRVKELSRQQEALLSERSATLSALRGDEQKLILVQSELDTHRGELKRLLQELLAEQQALDEVKTKNSQRAKRILQKQNRLETTQGELLRTQGELETTQGELLRTQGELETTQDAAQKRKAELDRRREEFAELQENLETHSKEAQRQKEELQDEEEVRRRREERSSLQDQCKHLEARRRHADRCLSAAEAELAKQREELDSVQLLKQEVQRGTAASQEQLDDTSALLSLLAERVEERKKELQNLEQAVDIKAAVSQLEDRGRRLNQQELQLNQLKAELRETEKQLLHKEEELNSQREGLNRKEEELNHQKEELQLKEAELVQTEEEDTRGEGGSIFLSTPGLTSAFRTEEEGWRMIRQREELRQQEDRLKARLRRRLWSQQETQEERRLETQESLNGLKVRLDRLDSLLTQDQGSTGRNL